MTDTRLRGFDVSGWQGAIDWPIVARSTDLSFVYVRASHGVTADAFGPANLRGARLAGLRVGAYHYLEQRSAPDAQARAFLETLSPDVTSLPARLLPMLDVEEGDGDVGTRMVAWLRCVEALSGVRAGVYTTPSFAAAHGLARWPELAASPLWVAHWTAAEAPALPEPWTSWAIWQHTNRIHVAGVSGPIDGNIAAGALPEAT